MTKIPQSTSVFRLFVIGTYLIVFTTPLLALLISQYFESRSGSCGASLFTDDFYYYWATAKNFARTGIPSFDHENPTNGFHLIWHLMLTLTNFLPEWNCSDLQKTTILIGICNIFSLRPLILVAQTLRLSSYAMYGIIAIAASIIASSSKSGMETGIAVCFLLNFSCYALLSERPARPRIAPFTFLGILAVLARLESIIFVMPFGISFLIARELESGTKGYRKYSNALAFAIFVLFAMISYFSLNHLFFDSALPHSSVVKGLGSEKIDSLNALLTLLDRLCKYLLEIKFNWVTASHLLTYAAVTSVVLNWKFIKRPRLTAFALVWPCFHIGAAAFRSSWDPPFWYHYSFLYSGLIGILVLCRAHSLSFFRTSHAPPWIGALFLATLFTATSIMSIRGAMKSSVMISVQIGNALSEFMHDHPGRYAMGDMAGYTSYASKTPILHVEGLVGGNATVIAITKGVALKEFLLSNRVDFYIGTHGQKINQSCWSFREPSAMATNGAHSFMQDVFCSEPLLNIFPENYTGGAQVFSMKSELEVTRLR